MRSSVAVDIIRRRSAAILGRCLTGRIVNYSFETQPSDIYLVSYPKSGNTWTRFLIANIVHAGASITFSNIHHYAPDANFESDSRLKRAARPRVLKTHSSFNPEFHYCICIVRDPRDVAVSYYHWLMNRGVIESECSLNQFIPAFVSGQFGSSYGSWAENVGSWIGARRESPGFILLKYEDLLLNACEYLVAACEALELPYDESLVYRAIENSSAERMREMEKQTGSGWAGGASLRRGSFVRQAKAGQWQNELNADSVNLIESRFGRVMREVGYSLSDS